MEIASKQKNFKLRNYQTNNERNNHIVENNTETLDFFSYFRTVVLFNYLVHFLSIEFLFFVDHFPSGYYIPIYLIFFFVDTIILPISLLSLFLFLLYVILFSLCTFSATQREKSVSIWILGSIFMLSLWYSILIFWGDH